MATDSVTVSPTFNGDSVSLTTGMIVRLKPGANNNVVRAQANSAPNVQGVNGVVVSGSSAPGGVLTVVCTGRETVQMESALTPNVGDTVYVSPNVAGKGTNVLPAEVSAIGTIADVSAYAASKTVEVDVVVSAVTPASVSGVSSVNTTKPGDSVVPNVGAVIIKGGGVAEVDTVNTAGNMLSALNAANFPVGNTLCWVASVGAYFQLQISALAVDHITVETASGLGGAQWLRINLPNRANWTVTSWSVDPSAGNDENNGLTDGTALKTRSELARRLWGATTPNTVTVRILANVPASDKPTWLLFPNVGFIFAGVSTPIYTSTISTYTAASAGPSATDNEMTDAAVPGGSFTAAGAMADGVQLSDVNGNFWFAALDKGSKTLRVSRPATAGISPSALTPGAAYNANSLPQIAGGGTNDIWLSQPFSNVRYQDLYFAAAGTFLPFAYRRCAAQGNNLFQAGTWQTCGIFSTLATTILSRPTGTQTTWATSLFRCTGSSVLHLLIGGETQFSENTFQGCGLSPQDGAFLNLAGNHYVYDSTVDAIYARYWSTVLWQLGGVFIGSGNTANLLRADEWSSIAYVTSPVVVAGSSSSGTPITSGPTSVPVSGLPIPYGIAGQGIFQTDVAGAFARQPTVIASGAGVLAVTNAPAGATAYARWVTMPDGLGGTITFGSTT